MRLVYLKDKIKTTVTQVSKGESVKVEFSQIGRHEIPGSTVGHGKEFGCYC
jgi:hypothetical protein